MDDAAKLGYDLCEAIYAATRVGQGQVGDTKRCEVKPNTVAKLIGALRPGRAIYYLILFSRQVLFFWGVPGSCFPAFLLLCLLLFCSLLLCFLLSCFSACLLLCFSAFLLLCVLLFLLFAFPASLLYLLLFFSASLLLCFCASVPFYFYYSTFVFSSVMCFAALLPDLSAPLLLCFLSLLPLCFFSFLLLYSLLLVSQMKPYRP